jgi:hypothetical protein
LKNDVTEKGFVRFAALGPWLYLDIFRRETEETSFSYRRSAELAQRALP